jgi:molecular chaperone GrpE
MRNKHHDKPEGRTGEPATGAAPETRILEEAEAVVEPPKVEELQKALAEKEKELAELKDKYLRALADSENARRRIRQQADDSIRLQRENLLRELLPIVDNLERAVDAARGGGNGKPIVEGVEMTLRSMLDFLKAHNVTPLGAVGQPFDPSRHEAVDHVQSDEHAPNTVVDEFHRGYLIGDRVLRPARVSVAKEAAEASPTGRRSNGEDPDSGVENN